MGLWLTESYGLPVFVVGTQLFPRYVVNVIYVIKKGKNEHMVFDWQVER